jgi:serine/threonine protein kinase/tetratricopeptide (TPR) repeat protein
MSISDSQLETVVNLADEYLARLRRGEQPSLTEYIDRYPHLAGGIRDVFPLTAMMEEVAGASPKPDAGDQARALTADHSPLPARLGDYRILREVGRGGMGIVYEAEHVRLKRHVALKVLQSAAALAPARRERFEREARIAAMLHHTNIVPVFDVGEEDGTTFYAMQFIEGQGLDDVLEGLRRLRSVGTVAEEGTVGPPGGEALAAELAHSMVSGRFGFPGPANARNTGESGTEEEDVPHRLSASNPHLAMLETAEEPSSSGVLLPGQSESSFSESGAQYFASVARIGVQVASALEYAHSHATLHRDIKPSNLLLDVHGTVWVADFGLAKFIQQDDLTRTGELIGTLRYIPPEHLEGLSDARSDIYSLGLTLYELLTLEPANDETDRARLLRSIAEREPTRPRKLDLAIPRDLETIVLKAIEREPKRRYQTAAELGADLERFLEGKPIHARQVGVWERTVKAIRRRPAVSTLAALLLLSVIVGFALVMWKWQEAEHQRTLASEEAARNDSLLKTESKLRRQADEARQAESQQTDVARREAAQAEQVANFLIGLFQGSDPLGLSGYRFGPPPGETSVPTADDLLRRGTERIRSELAEAPEIQATVMDHLGRTWLSRGSIGDAEPLLQQALDWRLNEYGSQHPDTANSLAALGMVRYVQGNYEAAVPLLRDAAAIAENSLDASDPKLGRIKFLFACVLLESRGGPSAIGEAHRVLEGLVASLRPHAQERRRDLAFALAGLAMSQHVRKDFPAALKSLSEATALSSAAPETDPVVGALILSISAATNWKRGEYETAQRQTDRCVRKFQEILGRDHPAVNYLQVYTAQLIYKAGDLEQAESLLRKGVADAHRTFGRQPRTAQTMAWLAEVLIAQREFDEAESICRDALSITMTVLGPENRQTKAILRLLSRIADNR